MTGERRYVDPALGLEDDTLDHPDHLPADTDDVELVALFAEANDPASPVTVEQVEQEWADIREAGGL